MENPGSVHWEGAIPSNWYDLGKFQAGDNVELSFHIRELLAASNRGHTPKWLKPYRKLSAHRPRSLEIKQSQGCPVHPSGTQVFLSLHSVSLSTLASSLLQQLQAAWFHTRKSKRNKEPNPYLFQNPHW